MLTGSPVVGPSVSGAGGEGAPHCDCASFPRDLFSPHKVSCKQNKQYLPDSVEKNILDIFRVPGLLDINDRTLRELTLWFESIGCFSPC